MLNSCLASTFIWVINSSVIDYRTDNYNLLSTFQSHITSFFITLIDGSTFCIVDSKIANPTLSISLSSILCLQQLSLNLLSTSKFIQI